MEEEGVGETEGELVGETVGETEEEEEGEVQEQVHSDLLVRHVVEKIPTTHQTGVT